MDIIVYMSWNKNKEISEQFNLYYENNSKELIQQGILKRRQYGIGVAIVNIDIDVEITYIMINDIPNTMVELKELILNDLLIFFFLLKTLRQLLYQAQKLIFLYFSELLL